MPAQPIPTFHSHPCLLPDPLKSGFFSKFWIIWSHTLHWFGGSKIHQPEDMSSCLTLQESQETTGLQNCTYMFEKCIVLMFSNAFLLRIIVYSELLYFSIQFEIKLKLLFQVFTTMIWVQDFDFLARLGICPGLKFLRGKECFIIGSKEVYSGQNEVRGWHRFRYCHWYGCQPLWKKKKNHRYHPQGPSRSLCYALNRVKQVTEEGNKIGFGFNSGVVPPQMIHSVISFWKRT